MRRLRIAMFLLVVLGPAATGCSTVSVHRVKPGDARTPGIRYYRPAPYLVVSEGKASIVYLPDRSEEYAITQHAGLGSRKLEVTLTDGWNLTKLGADAGAVPDKAIELLGKILLDEKLRVTGGRPGEKATLLYRLVYDEQGRGIVALEPVPMPGSAR